MAKSYPLHPYLILIENRFSAYLFYIDLEVIKALNINARIANEGNKIRDWNYVIQNSELEEYIKDNVIEKYFLAVDKLPESYFESLVYNSNYPTSSLGLYSFCVLTRTINRPLLAELIIDYYHQKHENKISEKLNALLRL